MSTRRRATGFRLGCGVAVATLIVAAATPLQARTRHVPTRKDAEVRRILERLERQEAELKRQGEVLQTQRALLDQQAGVIARQSDEIAGLRAPAAVAVAASVSPSEIQRPPPPGGAPSGAFAAAQAAASPNQVASVTPAGPTQLAPLGPVGEAPPDASRRVAAVLPQEVGVLTPKGRLTLDPSVEYSHTSANRLVFRGVEIVPGVQLGAIEANDTSGNLLVGGATARYGLTNRLELEVRVPYLYRNDRITQVQQRDQSVTRTTDLTGSGIGDVEAAARYQLNAGGSGLPIFVADARVKSDTGKGPFSVGFDQFGIATSLATGSGFWGLETGLTMLYPTDPAVIFANVNYLDHFGRHIDKVIGGAEVGFVNPGDAIGISAGFGFAVNPRFSFSLGYRHNYVFETETKINGVKQYANDLQVGSLLVGSSFRLTDRLALSTNFEFGVTADAPDVMAVVRLPITF